MNDSGKRDHLRKLLNLRMAIVDVGIAETNEEAWLRHLTTNPEDLYANIRIFNRQKMCRDKETSKLKPLEEVATVANNKQNSEAKL